MIKNKLTVLAAVAALAFGPVAFAAEDESCGTVRFGQVNWTGVSGKTETAAWMLEQMGYKTDVITASVPIMFSSLAENERDAFLGLWLPTQRSMITKYMTEGRIDIVSRNLENAKYTVGVSREAWENGVKHFSDLAKHADKFDNTILGIEAGNDGNVIIKQRRRRLRHERP